MNNKKLTTKTLSAVASCLIATTSLFSQELSTITVSSATKAEQSIKDVTSNVEVITKEEIEERHFTTVSEALDTLSGISFTSNGGIGKSSSVYLRGFDSKRVLVLLDGIRYNDMTSTSGAPFENIMLNDIKQIELIKGAQSGIWGADASAGVINIITNKAKNGFSGSLSSELGSFGTKKYGALLSYGTEKYYVKASYNKLKTDGITAHSVYGTNIDSYEKDGYENETSNIKTGFNFDDSNSIHLTHTQSKSESEFDNFGSDSLTNSSSSKNRLTGLSYQNDNSFASSTLTYNKSSFYRNYPPYASTYEGDVDEIGFKTNIDYMNKSSFLVLGLDYKKFDQEDIINKGYKNKAFFITNSNKFDEKLILTQSLRFDNYDKFDNKTTGKVGIKYNFSDDLYSVANIGTAYNIPKLNELYGAFGANPNLNPETTKSYDISFGYQDLELTYFHNEIENMIDWNGAGYNNLSGKSILKGFEVDYKKDVNENTLISLSYTKLSAKDKDKKDLARRPKQTIKTSIDYYGLTNFHINANAQYIGERYNGINKTGRQTGKYTVFNSVVNYEFNKDITVYLKLDNILDKYYQTVDGYATAPRSAYLGLNYKF